MFHISEHKSKAQMTNAKTCANEGVVILEMLIYTYLFYKTYIIYGNFICVKRDIIYL